MTWSAVPLRAVLVLAASGGLHWGVWQAIEGPDGRAGGAVRVTAPVTPTPTMTWVMPGAVGGAAPTVRTGEPPTVRTGEPPTVRTAKPSATPPLHPAAARPATAPPAQAPAIAWLEVWEVDEPPQFLVAPDDLEGLARHVGRPLRARVSLRIGTDGRPAGLELHIDGVEPAARAALLEALEAAFAPLAFLPARRDGRPVPVVQRWELALDPQVPVALGMAPVN